MDTIPGVARATAELIVSEIGTDIERFPSPGHLAAWAGMSPGNNESAGKRLSGRIRQRAIIAVAHSILVIAYRLIERGEDYKDLGEGDFDQRRPEQTARHLMSCLVQLGYEVTLNPQTEAHTVA